MLHRAETPTGT